MIAAARIRRLPQVVADAIAAGEVVERPASVIKELIENSLDAGAAHVDVAVEGGGLVRIEVADDGAGIAAADLALAVARHATSNIARAADLSSVRTLGFRGEALASIAAVSDLRLVSCARGAAAGAELRVRCGEPAPVRTAAAAVGTRVEVCELFATTPARLRFLRSSAAEAAAAMRVVGELALLHPDIAFTCRVDGRVALRTPGGTLRDALRAVYGARSGELLDVDAPGAIAVHGAISTPQGHRGQRALVLAVNGRRVQHRGLQVAVEDAYRGLIPVHRFPYGVVRVDIDPAEVDVNIHPAKREVRFRDERRVFTAVQRACWTVLQGAPVLEAVLGERSSPGPDAGGPNGLTLEDARGTLAFDGDPAAPAEGTTSGTGGGPPNLRSLAPLRAVGQAGGTWLVAESRGGVVLVDPHAAHEKALYAELLDRWSLPGRGGADTQLLLIPLVVACDPARLEAVERNHEFMEACGFQLEVFGRDSVRCTAVPATGGAAASERLVEDLLDALGDARPAPDARRDRVAALVACHCAVRFGDRLDADAQQRLLDRLVATPGGTTCPHGRPALIVLDDAMLRRAFRRPPR